MAAGRSGWARVHAWPVWRVRLAAVAGGLLLSAAVLGYAAPLLAQDGEVGIRFGDLSSEPTHTTVDRFAVELSGLTAAATYEVVVSSDRAATVGIGNCGTATQSRSVTGVEAQDLPFLVYACAVGEGTLTATVRRRGAATADASVSQRLTVLAIPAGAPPGVPGATGAQGTSGVTRVGTPGIVPGVSFPVNERTTTSVQATWGAPSDGSWALTGFGLLFWRKAAPAPPYASAFVAGPASRSHRYTGLQHDTTYLFRIHACNEDDNMVARCGWWTDPPLEVTTQRAPTPDRPHTIRFSNLTARSARVTWSIAANTGGVALTGFDLRYWPYDAANPDSEAGAATHPADDGRDTGETLRGLAANTEYELKMRACNGPNKDRHCSPWSDDHRFTTTGSTTPTPTPTPEASRPQNLNVVPRAGREAVLTWDEVPGATSYQVQAQVLGTAVWQAAECEGDPSDMPGVVAKPKCVIDLEFIARISGSLAGLHTNKAYALQVQAVRPRVSAFSEPIVIVDTPIFMAKGTSGSVDVTWTPVDSIHSDLRAGGSYQLKYRKFKGDHTSVAWDPATEAFDPTKLTAVLPSGTTTQPIGSLDNYGLYAIQLLYNAPRPNAAAIKVFAARDAYAWPSDRAASGGERVGTFPLSSPVSNRTYAYHICSDTFPTVGGAPEPPDELAVPDALRAKARTFIQDAFGQWETATKTGPDTSLITMEYLGAKCANYETYISRILLELQDHLEDDVVILEAHVRALVRRFDLTDFTKEDRDRNEVIYMDLTENQARAFIFSKVSEVIGLASCGVTGAVACAVPSLRGGDTVDILLPGRQFRPSQSFAWDVPAVAFNLCEGGSASSVTPKYATLVHEAGHALGVRGTSTSGGTGQQIHHSQVADSTVKSTGLRDSVTDYLCSPTPFDVMAIYALYQTED